MSTEQAAELPVVAYIIDADYKDPSAKRRYLAWSAKHAQSVVAHWPDGWLQLRGTELTDHATATAQIAALRAELEKAMEDAYTYTLQMARWFCLNRDANTQLADVFAFYNFAKKVEAAVGQSNPYLAGMEEKFGCVERGA